MKGRAIPWSDEEIAWIEARKDMPRRELHDAFCAAFRRDDVSLGAFKSLCKRKGFMTGRSGQFPSGHVPDNKGRKGCCAPGSEKGWFRKGERRGVARRLWKPIGSERISRDGYVERKINDDLPLQARWRAVHLIRWEEANGPLPEGHALKCLDGDRTNTDPSNWKAVPRAMLPRLAGRWSTPYDQAAPELRPTILAIAELEHKARTAKKSDKP